MFGFVIIWIPVHIFNMVQLKKLFEFGFRLSDFLFAAARYVAHKEGRTERIYRRVTTEEQSSSAEKKS